MPYFDYNATTPLSATAKAFWLKANEEQWQNPSSLYRDATKSRIRIDNARKHLADILEAREESIVFNSGATEGAHAIFSYLAARDPTNAPLIVNRTEHPAVLEAARWYFGDRIRWLDTETDGVVNLDQLAALIDGAAGVVVMAANNETGVIQPWANIAKLCQRKKTPYICDASQWLGKLPAGGLGAIDWVIGAGHKFGAPKGVGFIKIAADAKSLAMQPGGSQENGHRGGTEDLASIWAMTEALAEADQTKVLWESERLRWRASFEAQIKSLIPRTEIVAEHADRLWNTVSLKMPSGENQRWVTKLDKLGFQVSTGSACATGKDGPSHVLTAMGFSASEAKRVIRISSGWETSEKEWTELAHALTELAPELNGKTPNVVQI